MNDNQTTVPGASAADHRTAVTGAVSQPSAATMASQTTAYDSAPTQAAAPIQEATPAAADTNTLVDQVLDRSKQWINDSGLGQRVNELPQTLRDLGNQAVSRVAGLSTTQKIVGGAILAAGIGWLATRVRSVKDQPAYDANAAASTSRPGSRYSSNSYANRGSASYASGSTTRSVGNPAVRPNHFSNGDADGYSNDVLG